MASESLFSAEQIKIPADLPEIMKNYTKYIIKTQPQDIIAASSECVFLSVTTPLDIGNSFKNICRYFGRLSKQKAAPSGGKRLSNTQLEAFYAKVRGRS